ncbi:hypothetical protein PP633_22570 [Mycobacteroides abscessus]|uniref:Uncharacterized protein n=1 Tax=Mycobacteroides abscessus subsp. bolletii 1513 TaxID=1299321 RepID=X8DEC5_9MYCO|nr:hypothetical protein [Mycobacteroides abscessus]EUA66426.1 hypothetical protein I540_5788 [Mycobacteroides abscessus subsp. bolletii 1513]AMU29170.1 hypothetical protein A3N97_00035 [Mycobacteroides abscessus]ANN97327.1 hypothetical protein BAB74_00035 [Mycobacteroides abscessus]EIU08316.1 hypothetical protein MA5S0421_4602 [Mycobacteroides abscessus 5S-0421]EIU10068.1 hypothetical protein MA5S0304_4367 [Mycobacteroides abscessus 5S-0304]
MGEKFSVDIEKLAGFGGGVEDLAGYLGKVQGLVDGEAGPKDGWEGLMSQLKGPFESTKTKTSQRYDQRQVAMYMTGNELISLANTYKEQENKTGDRIRAAASPLPGHDSRRDGDATTTAAHLSTGDTPDLTPPKHEEADVVSIVRDKAAWVADADEAIQKVSGWSPINDTFEKLVGNWAELTRIGNVYEKAGKGMEGAGKSLGSMSDQSKSHWDGKSAQAFDEYAKKLSKALEAEAPLTKVIKDCLDVLVEQIKKLVKTIVDMVVEKLKEEVQIDNWKDALKVLAKKIPVAGTAWQIERLAAILIEVFQEAQKLVDQVQKAVDLVKSVIEFFEDPAEYLKSKGQDALNKAVDGALDKAGAKTDATKQLVKDLPAAVLAAPDYQAAPGAGYSGGTGGAPWEDGK